jgi:hypothetical protein
MNCKSLPAWWAVGKASQQDFTTFRTRKLISGLAGEVSLHQALRKSQGRQQWRRAAETSTLFGPCVLVTWAEDTQTRTRVSRAVQSRLSGEAVFRCPK